MRITAGAAVIALLTSGTVQAQVADSTHRLAVFAGPVGSQGGGLASSWKYAEVGGSADFHVEGISQALRASFTYRQGASSMKVGTASLDIVAMPLPSLFNMRPYLLGGLGLSRASSYSVNVPLAGAFDSPMTVERTMSAKTWMFVEAGGGVEIGQHFFVQTKITVPVAGTGNRLYPLNAGFRFSY